MNIAIAFPSSTCGLRVGLAFADLQDWPATDGAERSPRNFENRCSALSQAAVGRPIVRRAGTHRPVV